MTAKDLIINFLYLVFFLGLVGSCIFFFSEGGRFDAFTNFLRSAWPIGFALFALAFKLRLTNQEKKRGNTTGITIFNLTLSFNDKMKGEIVSFAVPLYILFTAAVTDSGVTAIDIMQAVGAFLIIFLWQKYLWLRAR